MKKIEEKLININKSKIIIFLFFIFIAIVWFLFTHITKQELDDIYYQYIDSDMTRRITNISDLILSQTYIYFGSNGRVFSNTLTQTFLMYKKVYFNIFNAIIFSGTVYLIYSFRKNKNNNLLLVIFIFLSFWFFCGDLYRSFIWESACFNYGWQIFFSLLYLKPYNIGHDNDKTIESNLIICFLYFLYALIVGCGHEVISPVVIISVFLYLLYKYKNKKTISKFEIFGFIGYCLGTLIMILAPGNYGRMNLVKGFLTQFDFFPCSIYIFAFLRNGYFLLYYTMPLIIVMSVILLYSIKKNNQINLLTKDYNLKLFYYLFILFFSSFFTFIFLGYANSIIIVPLTIMLIIIVRYIDTEYLEIHIEYFYLAMLLLIILFMCQSASTLYYCIVKGMHIEHGFKLVS